MPLELFQTILRQLDRLLMYFNLHNFLRYRHTAYSKVQLHDDQDVVQPISTMRPLHDFQREVYTLFSAPCDIQRMRYMSACLKEEYLKKLKSSTACMLPSFCHTLPTGQECGDFIALDLGGSTFRVAIVNLSTRSDPDGGMRIRHMTVHKINEKIRQYASQDFFAWMAAKIYDTLHQCKHYEVPEGQPIALGLAWSFPIEQTSYRGGTVQPMGKGFVAHKGIVGQDLGSLIESACHERGLQVRVTAIVNDSSATLLAQAYKDSTTSMGLILGTGTNAAVYLPVKALGIDKFGVRDQVWMGEAEKVIINTEVSMFGKNILPETRWDEYLNRAHCVPDFQPLEYMTTGRYLGEILRLIIAEAVDTCRLFGGVMPEAIRETYTLDTALLAAIEEDSTLGLISSAERVQKEFKLFVAPTPAEMAFLRIAVESISHRAAAYIAVAVHSLWSLQHDPTEERSSQSSVAANGSVITMYPGFRQRCHEHIASLISANAADQKACADHHISIQPIEEATILGTAVAVAVGYGPEQL